MSAALSRYANPEASLGHAGDQAPVHTDPRIELSVAKRLFDEAFLQARDPRSRPYKWGVLAALDARERREIGTPAFRHSPWPMGTPEADAYYAGVAEGNAIWRRHEAEQATGSAV